MKSKLLIGFLIAVIGYCCVVIRQLQVALEKEVVKSVNASPSQSSVIQGIDRGTLIRRVIKGDGQAALELERFYTMGGVTEAALYWVKKAKELGVPGATDEAIDRYEQAILNEYRDPK